MSTWQFWRQATILLFFNVICATNVWENTTLRSKNVEEYQHFHMVPQCAKKCVLNTKCKSFSYFETKGKCHLFYESPVGDNMRKTEGATLYTVEDYALLEDIYGPCSSSPCQNDGVCIENALGFVCVCQKGWDGQTCNNTVGSLEWDEWSEWGKCSRSCAVGSQGRRRRCFNAKTNVTISDQECVGSSSEYRTCNLQPCPRWRPWGEWEQCSAKRSCGNGEKVRRRQCYYKGVPRKDGLCFGPTSEVGFCTGPACDAPIKLQETVNGTYGEGAVQIYNTEIGSWGFICPDNWKQENAMTACHHLGFNKGAHEAYETKLGIIVPYHMSGVTCKGTEVTLPECLHNGWQNPGKCEGSNRDRAASVKCIVDGQWASWYPWSPCSVTCGNGTKMRTRTCEGPPPTHGGDPCPGGDIEHGSCTMPKCPVDGSWKPWSDWSVCNVTCGGGSQIRHRQCKNPKHGGKNCTGNASESQLCNYQHCPVDGQWSTWLPWGACSVTCEDGTRIRVRKCDAPPPQYGGHDCPGNNTQHEPCRLPFCPIDGTWLPWSAWDACTLSCGTGKHNRKRSCKKPMYGGQDCYGPSEEEGKCNEQPCPIDGVWEEWNDWDECSKSCGTGNQNRRRECKGPYWGGRPCMGRLIQLRNCNTDPC